MALKSMLEGNWELVYASNGTVVTRTPLVMALVALSRCAPDLMCQIQRAYESMELHADAAGARVLARPPHARGAYTRGAYAWKEAPF